METIIGFLCENLDKFIIIYMFEHFIHKLDRSMGKEVVTHIG